MTIACLSDVTVKTCFKCKSVKPRTEFYAHPAMGDGLLGKCKDCTKADAKARYIAKHNDVMEYERKRAASRNRKQRALQYQRNSRAANPDRNRARSLVNYRVRNGLMKRQPCEVCGNVKSEAHHDDYSKPLSVRWLCHIHHRMAHGRITPTHLDFIQRH